MWRPTTRQREVILLAAQGLSNKEIARQLNIFEGTVKVHLHRIYGGLGIRGRTSLPALVQRWQAGAGAASVGGLVYFWRFTER
jgi:DNA-binding NarL/FixJ family response regulator